MYRVDSHDCGQTKLGSIMQKFRNSLKTKMGENFKNRFHNVFADEKKALLNRYKDETDLLERIVYELKVCVPRELEPESFLKIQNVVMKWISI